MNVANGQVLGEIEGLGINTSETMRVTLGPGSYALRCLIEDVDPIMGPTVHITGTGTSSPGVVPVTTADLLDPLKQYQAYVTAGVADLVSQDRRLAGRRAQRQPRQRRAPRGCPRTSPTSSSAPPTTRSATTTARSTAPPPACPDGVQDAGFTGFHRVEYGLWHGESAASLTGPADQLDGYVHGLQNDLPQMETEALDIGLRAHEIMENTLQFEFTGKTDYGSGTNLATALANLQGDQEVVSVLRPLLTTRYPQLSQVDEWTSGLQTLLQAQQHPDGSWTPVAQLSSMDREAAQRGTVRADRTARPDRGDHRTEEGVMSERGQARRRPAQVPRRRTARRGPDRRGGGGIAGGVAYAGDDAPVHESSNDAELAALTGNAPARADHRSAPARDPDHRPAAEHLPVLRRVRREPATNSPTCCARSASGSPS